ncbi:MAG: glycine cleavage system protein GcvH [Chloroflexi bacterium]|nr:glycine cleavage system protein GcvH [Chloroflexota bacterium]
MEIPADRRYSKEHEWALLEGDGTVRVGISEFAAHELGDVIFVEVPAVGARVTQGEHMGEIESVKAVSDLFSPITGEIVEINADIKSKPELVNEDPFTGGWLVRVKPDNADDLNNLLDPTAYKSITE